MNINQFKAAIQEKNAVDQAVKDRNRVNIASLQLNTTFDISDHPRQVSKYNITYNFYNSVDDFDNTPNIPKSFKGIMPKMLNWRKTEADYYIWLDETTKLSDKESVDWMVDYLVSSDFGILLFPHPTRANIVEEVDYIETEIKNGNQEIANQYNIDQLKTTVQSYIKDFPDLKTYPLFDTRAFVYSGELVKHPRHVSNFLLSWFTQTIIGGMSDVPSLIYALRCRGLRRGLIPESLSTGTYIKLR